MATDTRMTGDFIGKLKTKKLADDATCLVAGFGPVKTAVKAQATFAVTRKFLWL